MRKNRIVLYLMAFLQGMVFYASIATLYREERGLSMLALGGIESASMLLTLVLELPWGFLAGKLGYKRTLLLVNGVYFLSKVVFWQAHSFAAFLLERLMLSFVMAGQSGVDNALLYESSRGMDSRKVFGLWNGASTGGVLLASLGYSLFMGGNYDLAAFATVAVYGLAFVASFFLQEPRQADLSGQNLLQGMERKGLGRQLWADLKGQASFLPFLLAGVALAEANQFVTVFLAQLQYRAAGMASSFMGYAHMLLTLAGLSALLAGPLSRRLGRNRTGRLCFIAAFLACLVLALQRRALPSLLCFLLLRFAASLFLPLDLDAQNERAESRRRPWILSVFSMERSLVSVPIYLAFGQLSESSLPGSMAFGALLCLAGLCLLLFWQRRHKEGPPIDGDGPGTSALDGLDSPGLRPLE